jgi:hypothetical protein
MQWVESRAKIPNNSKKNVFFKIQDILKAQWAESKSKNPENPQKIKKKIKKNP